MWVMRVLRGDVGDVHALDVLQDLFRTLTKTIAGSAGD